MTDQSRRPDGHRSVPFDLVVTAVAAIAATVLVFGSAGFRPDSPPFAYFVGRQLSDIAIPPLVRAIAGLVLLFFLPGYAYVAAVFPHRPIGTRSRSSGKRASARPLTAVERAALSFGMSVGLLSLLGLGIAVTSWEYSRLVGGGFLLLSVLVGVLLGTARGHVSLIGRPRDEIDRLKRTLTVDDSAVERAVSAALVVSALLALSTLTLALVVPHTGEAYTGVTLLSPNEGGEPIAGNYSTTLVQHRPEPFLVAIQNREGAPVNYTLVVTEQRVAPGSRPVSVVQERELLRRTVAVPAGADKRIRTRVAPTMRGSSLRLMFYLYRGTAPGAVSADTAYRRMYLWVDVRSANSET